LTELSVVLPVDRIEAARETLASLRRQSAAERLELVWCFHDGTEPVG